MKVSRPHKPWCGEEIFKTSLLAIHPEQAYSPFQHKIQGADSQAG
jgi:hypothetical protein